MIDMSELLCDPDFCEEFTVLRKSGDWINRRWVETEQKISVMGVATAVNNKDFDMLPEGDRVSGLRTFYTNIELCGSSDTSTADICEYRGSKYRIFQVFNYSNNGFYKAMGKLVGGV